MKRLYTFFFALLFASLSIANPTVPDVAGTELALEQKRQAEINALDPSNTVFGANLFMGHFSAGQNHTPNPHYEITVGDKISVQIWGAFNFNQVLEVDMQGNIFITRVGPIRVAGVANQDLNSIIEKHLQTIFTQNVNVYANLETVQSIKVYVTGYVNKPGLYDGLASDSILYYLDKAQGINTVSGSFRNVKVIRNNQPITNIDLYDFLLGKSLSLLQLRDGDTIVVGPIGNTITVKGTVSNPYQFEIRGSETTVNGILELARPLSNSTYIHIDERRGESATNDYVLLKNTLKRTIYPGTRINIAADHTVETITVEVNGAVKGPSQYALPTGTRLSELLPRIPLTELAIVEDVQLFRKSVAVRQKASLNASLDSLEKSIFTTGSMTVEGAEIRSKEAELLVQFINKARQVVPKGQVVLGTPSTYNEIYLEPDDILHIPTYSSVVLVSGQVNFPTSMAIQPGLRAADYIKKAGGFTDNADKSYLLVIRRNGSIERIEGRAGSYSVTIREGDEIIVPPKADTKSLQVGATIAQIIYQVAIAARVVLRL